jgi:hypothetical protein
MQQLERCRKSMPSCAPPSAPGCAGRGRHGRNRNRCGHEGVFGSRRIHEGRVMTRDTIFRAATPNSATVITSGRRAYSKPYIIRTSLYSIIR